jgi:hypothetical protein
MGRGTQDQGQGQYRSRDEGYQTRSRDAQGMGRNAANTRMPSMQGSPSRDRSGNYPQAMSPMGNGVASTPWGDMDWMKLREGFQGRDQGGHPGAQSQTHRFSPSGGTNPEGFRPQGVNPITTAGSVAGTQQSPTSSVETGVTPPSSTVGAQPAPQGPPPANPSGQAASPGQPSGPLQGQGNPQALIQALRQAR